MECLEFYSFSISVKLPHSVVMGDIVLCSIKLASPDGFVCSYESSNRRIKAKLMKYKKGL